jgi:hypothetical protein
MTTKTESALDGLDRHEREVIEARERLAELEAKRKDVRGALDDAMKPLRDYYRETEAGRRTIDVEEEGRLRQAMADAQARVAPMASINPRAARGVSDQLHLVDPELEGQLAGAKERVREAEAEYNRYRSARFDDLVVELGTLGAEFTERYRLAIKHARRGHKEWRALKKRWEPILEVSDFDRADFPASPFEGVHSEPLMPRKLARGEEVDGPRSPARSRFRKQR